MCKIGSFELFGLNDSGGCGCNIWDKIYGNFMLNVYYIGKCAKFSTFQIRPNNYLSLAKAGVQKMKSTTLTNLRVVFKNYPQR